MEMTITMTIPVQVTRQDIATAHFDGSMIILTGTGPAGERVTFAGDARPTAELLNYLASPESDEADVDVETWQVLSREAA